MSVFKDKTGIRYGLLVVIGIAGKNRHGHILWKCRCDCGKEVTPSTSYLASGQARSCGCERLETHIRRCTKHGCAVNGTKTPEYKIWTNMKRRCSRDQNYKSRGIKVCSEWAIDFRQFLKDMGVRPSPKHTIERKNNDGDYTPKNCKWATMTEQARNKRTNHLLTYNGVTKTIIEWSEVLGFKTSSIIHDRLRKGWTVERIVANPKRIKASPQL